MLLRPTPDNLDIVIKRVITEIAPMERVKVMIPRRVSHYQGTYNWANLELLRKRCRRIPLKPDVFVTIRYGDNPKANIVMDICCIPSFY